jgi:cobalamin synthase
VDGPSGHDATSGGERDPDEGREADRRFSLLLEGLRTTLPGVQVLFAFLLILPVQGRFENLNRAERVVYVVALVSAAIASVLLIAPSVHQRLRVPADGVRRRHLRHVDIGAYLAIGGTVAFSISLVSSALLAVTIVYDNTVAVPVAAGIALVMAWAWYWLPLRTFERD